MARPAPPDGNGAQALELVPRYAQQFVRPVRVNAAHGVRRQPEARGLKREGHPRGTRVECREAIGLARLRVVEARKHDDEQWRAIRPAPISISNDGTEVRQSLLVVGVHEEPGLNVRRRGRPSGGLEERRDDGRLQWVRKK